MQRVYNFSAGPAVLPVPVLQQAANEMLNYNNSGMSIMEMSHRGKIIDEIMLLAEAGIKDLMHVPNNYKILFLQGGASLQFAMVPLNLLNEHKTADYINTGQWSKKAIEECGKFGTANIAASSAEINFTEIPDLSGAAFSKDASYVHVTSNNTVYGTKYLKYPDTGGIPLVADMSSSILSEPVDVSKFGLIYAGAQKNIGPAGVTVVIVNEELLKRSMNNSAIPAMLNYNTFAESRSLYNTPPTYGIYIISLVTKWLETLGGIEEIGKINNEKAAILYNYLDESKIFTPIVKNPHRSIMNVIYKLPNEELTAKFVKCAEKSGLVGLKGYRAVGGIRASIYNAMPIDGVKALVNFMKKFEMDEV